MSSCGVRLLALVATLLAGCGTTREGSVRTAPWPEGPFALVLGTAQDGGFPHAACACPRCARARRDPARKRRVASLALVDPVAGAVFLVDATPDFPDQLASLRPFRDAPAGRVDRDPLHGVLVTHGHMGHVLGLAWLGYEAIHAGGTPVWASERTAAWLAANDPWRLLVERGEIELRPLRPGESLELTARLEVTPLRVPHREERTDTLAFLVRGPRRTMLYAPDTDTFERWDPPLEERLAEVDLALIDGTFFSANELPGRDVRAVPHPLVTETLARLARLDRDRRPRILFTHLNHSNPLLEEDSEARRRLVAAGCEVATDGLVLEL